MDLENGLVNLRFDDSTGSLRAIRDLKTGKEWLQDPRGFRLAKLVVPTPDYHTRPLYSHLAGTPRLQKSGDTLTIDFPPFQDHGVATGVRVRATVRLPAGSPEALFTLEIENDGPGVVQEVWFPWVAGFALKSGALQETLTLSQNLDLGRRFPTLRTHTFGSHHQRLGLSNVSLLPMVDLSGPRGGLSYIRYEDKPCYNALVFENLAGGYVDQCLSWAWASRPFAKTGQRWSSATFGIGVHRGDWHVTADRLRSFMQPWWKPSGMPPALREKIGLYHVQFRGFNGEPYNSFEALPEMASDCRRYGVEDICMWDVAAQVYLRPDDGGFWEMPPERLEALKRALAETGRSGSVVGPWVNFRLITEHARLWRQMEPYAVRSVFGKAIADNWPCSMNHAIYQNPLIEQSGHCLCQASEGFRTFAFDLVDRTMGLGFTSLFIDQAAEWNSCMAENHGHRTPEEAFTKSYAWTAEATARVRRLVPGAYTVAEICDLYNAQAIDLWWHWGWRDHFRSDVFRYLIPEMLVCWCIDENERDVLSKAFAMGHLMAIATRDMTGRLSDAPELAEQVARLAQLRKATAPYVSHGRFLDRHGLEAENGEAYLFASDVGLAVTLANGRRTRRTIRVALEPDAAGDAPSRAGVLHVEGAEPVPVTPRERGGRWSIEVPVPAYGAAVWTLPRSGGTVRVDAPIDRREEPSCRMRLT